MGSCLTISHTCLLCQPSGRVSPFVSGVFEGIEDACGAVNVGCGWLPVYGICNRRLVFQGSGWYQTVINLTLRWCWLLQLNPGTRGEHITSQLSWVAVWLLVTHVCPVHLAGKLVLVFYGPLWFCWRFLEWLVWLYFYGELMLFHGMDMEFKGKIIFYRFREVKCQQSFITGIWY